MGDSGLFVIGMNEWIILTIDPGLIHTKNSFQRKLHARFYILITSSYESLPVKTRCIFYTPGRGRET